MRYLFVMLLGWLPMLVSAVDFDETTQSLPLGRVMQVFEDVDGQATLADVIARDGLFRNHEKDSLNAGYSHSAFWLKVDLSYLPQNPNIHRTWLLELAYPPMDHIDLYLADASGNYRLAERTGDALPFDSRQIKENNYLFELNFSPGQSQTVYLRLASQGSVQAPLTLWSAQAYLEQQPVRIYILGLIYGVLLGMLVYNLFIYLSVRDTSYLYYIFYIASFGLYQLSVNGAAVQYFWPNNPWWANAATPFLIGSAAFFGCQFARTFLHTASHSRWLDRALMLLMAVGVLVMVLALTTSYAVSLRLATGLALAFIVTIFTSGVVAWVRGLRVARYFVIAWSAFLLGGLVNTLMVLGYLPNVFLTMYASQIGSAIEVGLLSLALADRINAMRDLQARTLQESGQKLAAMNQQLAHTNQLKDEFLATVTHELRTPMNGVIGSLELIKTLDMGPELELYTQTAEGSAREMMHMVNGILALTELQAGRLGMRAQSFALSELVQSLSDQYGPTARNKGLQFSYEIARNLPDQWVGDVDKIRQCLECLLDNAIKFTRVGGVILRVTGKTAGPGRWALALNVIDSGIGFVHIEEAELYQNFFQVDGSMTRSYGGLGIGLAICRRLVELLGGRLTHHSQPGQGSQFQLLLELESPLESTQQAEGLSRTPNECVVLLVEDSSPGQVVLRGMLLKLGYRVLSVDSGGEAIDVLRRERVDAVVLGCPLNLVSGTSMGGQLLTLAACAKLPVLALFESETEARQALQQVDGITDYLIKPVRYEDVQHLMSEWLLQGPEGKSAGL
ncbi:hybrid sensor histidine kinase/response regulator [Pseudomonas sp. Lz4W]|uniref:hybrid sensor histidine kinase/response regulator n=1 Tax=Pseudomonas sp. Lz4W TaxID=1206777 RepID=UPI0002882A70|nr:hybrid sensor histidine kinase/response regulator [Pseudomonas sp. Lz4W]AMB78124.1 hybrid sensor histidine kinase/response regulator [Pseudomonas fragi]AUB73844.1 hybrid sensor histidine kinase/response regulator [Pseudomonas sp. Lz4W]